MTLELKVLSALAITAALITTPAAAATVAFEGTLDLGTADYFAMSSLSDGSGRLAYTLGGGPSATLREGDTLEFTLNFTDPLTVVRPQYFWVGLGSSTAYTWYTTSGRLEFLGLSSEAHNTSAVGPQTNCCGYIGSGFHADDFGATGFKPLTFTGVRLIMTVLDFTPNGPSSRGEPYSYDRPYFFWSSSVPEPASWTMMIAGFGLAGTALRKSRRRPRVA